MHIKYITNVRIPTTRAQGYAIMKMCEEFLLAGVDIELIVPNRRSNEETSDPFKYYGIKNKFPIKKLRSFDLLGPFEAFGKFFYWIDMLSFLVSVRLNIRKFKGTFYTRDYLVALVLPNNSNICLEIHDLPKSNTIFKKVINKVDNFFVLNKYIRSELVQMGVKDEKILVSPSGVDINKYDIEVSKEEARTKLDLPKDKKIISYTGHFYDWKGVNTLADVARQMPENLFVFIGGVEPDLTLFMSKYGSIKNIIILPFIDRDKIPLYLKASDVLVLPNSSKEKISSSYTSPLKMFEYMASGTPIIASALPSIKEILNESNSILVEPDNIESFVSAIKEIVYNGVSVHSITGQALKDVSRYSWENRVNNILRRINGNL